MAGEINFGLIDPNGANALAIGFQKAQDRSNALQDRAALMQQHQMANRLAELQYKGALQSQSDADAERAAYMKGGDIMQNLTSSGLGKQALSYGKAQTEQQTAQMARAKGVYDLTKAATGAVVANPSLANATAALTRLGQLTGTDTSNDMAQLNAMGDDPVKIKAWAIAHSVDADKLLPKFEKLDNGGSVVMGSVDPITGQFSQNGAMQKIVSPDAQLSATTSTSNNATTNATSRANTRDTLAQAANIPLQANLAGARTEATTKATNRVQAQADLPKAVADAETAINQIDSLVGNKEKGTPEHPGFSTSVGATLLPGLKYVPGSTAADFNKRLEQLQGGAFLQAYSTLRGGGSITEVEGAKATAAINRMSTAQSEKEFKQAASDFKNVLQQGVARAKAKAGVTHPDFPGFSVVGGQ